MTADEKLLELQVEIIKQTKKVRGIIRELKKMLKGGEKR